MQFLRTLLDNLAYLNPIPLPGWLVWLGLAGLLGIALFNWRKYNLEWNARATWMSAALILATPFATLFFGLEFSTGSTLPVPGLPEEPAGSTMMIFSAIPWILAGGLLGPFAAAGLGILSGLLRGVWDTHTLFTALDFGLMAVMFAVASRQRYRTFLYRLLRQPLFSALSLTLPHAALFVLGTLFTLSASASVTERLDYAFSNLGVVSLAFAGEMLVAGLAAQIIATVFRNRWGSLGMLLPSPSERSIETRFIFGAGTIISILLLTLLIGDWLVAGAAARSLLRDRLKSSAELAAQNVPFFLETGQNLALQIASDPRLQDVDADLVTILKEHSQAVPYFSQLLLYDMQTNTMLAGYPEKPVFQLTRPEGDGVALAQQGVPNQIYAIPPQVEGEAAGVSFLAAVPQRENRRYVLIGRTYLSTNPYTRPLVNNLNSLAGVNGAGMLIADDVVVYHSEGAQNWTTYEGQQSDQPAFFDETASLGTRQLVYYQPVASHPWAVVLAIPAQETQQLAINIALPISLMIILLGLVALISLRVNLRSVTGSLQSLAAETKYLATGQLDRPLSIEGEDEVSELRRAFEQMRVSLQARLQDLNRLLIASQGVASSLTLAEALQPVLEAVVANGASSARIILLREMLPTPVETPVRFADGTEQDVYMHLDQQVLALAEEQERIVMATLSRTRGLVLDPNLPYPESLIALALRHENRYYGVLWAAYNRQRAFSDADLRFISTLASQASLAVANIRLFLTVELSRRQLEAILNSTPDPVLVTDASNRLILANPAAGHVFGVTIRRGERPDFEKTIHNDELRDLLQASATERHSAEITTSDGKTYLAMASPMTAEGKTVGRVCILRDVTQLKEIDTLKSDFVSTVSHDLRSPLTLMRGYATMLEMAGQLNEQQKNYARMIVQGVDSMAKLVNNLLDLGRIEFGVGLQVDSIPVLDILERVTGSLQMQAKQKGISLGVEIPKDLPHVIEADEALLHQALYNLVENALKYTPQNGEVTIRLETDPSGLTFAVQDRGIGIPEKDLPRLFEKFYRG
ncbi:MAG TPA: histidine kinase dimerization/phospho-acceptor domain-containing protein, partial [Anaerolineales bacterium]|nr:histidine kinase dimerization/phospho-acceptor domain-containing protein [Anaerolineales bacterium]